MNHSAALGAARTDARTWTSRSLVILQNWPAVSFNARLFSYPMTSPSGCLYCPDLWVLVNLLGVLLVAVDVEPDCGSGAARAAQAENNSGTIGKDDPEALRGKRGKMKKNCDCEKQEGMKL